MPKRPLPRVQAAIAVIEQDGGYLVSRRSLQAHVGGCWEFPGGKRRVGESWQACLKRELREELGVGVQVGRRLACLRFSYPDRRVCLQAFRCRVISGVPAPLASRQLRWVSARQLKRLRFPPANRPLLEELTRRRRLPRRGRRAILAA